MEWKSKFVGIIAAMFLVQTASGARTVATNSSSQTYYSAVRDFLSAEISKGSEISLYEHSIVGLAFLALGDAALARQQVEKVVQDFQEAEELLAGEKLWFALLLLQYENVTHHAKFRSVAENICREYFTLPRYQGLPAVREAEMDGVPWQQVVSLEDARVGVAVLRLMAKIAVESRYQEEAQRIEQATCQWRNLPKGSLLLMTMAPDDSATASPAADAVKLAPVAEKFYVVTDGVEATLRAHRWIRIVDLIQEWQEDAPNRIYDGRGAFSDGEAKEWYSPRPQMRRAGGCDVIAVCWDLFRRGWDPTSTELPAAAPTNFSEKPENPATHFETARIYLLAGKQEKAERWAQACVDEAGSDPVYSNQVASAWLILGKIYHDQASSADGQFKFEMADQLKAKRDYALREIQTGYPTASVADSSGFISYVVDVIKKLYN